MSLVRNKKVTLDYTILETLEAGIELFGYEVKSLRSGRGILDGSRVLVRGGEAFLVGSQIPPYQTPNTPTDYDEKRTRRLLLSKKQIAHLYEECEQEGLTAVAISLYNKKAHGTGSAGFIKCEVAIVKGKKKHDKRETLKKKDAARENERILKSTRR